MKNNTDAQEALDSATESGCLEKAMVIGKSASGKVEIFLSEADKEGMLVLLVRAQAAIIKSLDS